MSTSDEKPNPTGPTPEHLMPVTKLVASQQLTISNGVLVARKVLPRRHC